MFMQNYLLVPEIIARHTEWERDWCNSEECYDNYHHVDYSQYFVTFCDWDLLDTCPDLPHIRLWDTEREDERGNSLILHKVFLNDLTDEELEYTLEDFFEKCAEIMAEEGCD